MTEISVELHSVRIALPIAMHWRVSFDLMCWPEVLVAGIVSVFTSLHSCTGVCYSNENACVSKPFFECRNTSFAVKLRIGSWLSFLNLGLNLRGFKVLS